MILAESYFQPDLDKVITQECHPDLRGTNVLDFALALIAPLKAINEDFKANRAKNLSDLRVVRSTIQFEEFLNNEHDPEERRIRIINILPAMDESIIHGVGSQAASSLMYGISENPAWQMILKGLDADADPVNFIVQIPSALDTESIRDQITEFIEKFKLLTTNWIFEVV